MSEITLMNASLEELTHELAERVQSLMLVCAISRGDKTAYRVARKGEPLLCLGLTKLAAIVAAGPLLQLADDLDCNEDARTAPPAEE